MSPFPTDERAGEVGGCGNEHGAARRQRPGPNPGRDVVRGVVKAVREVEAERDRNDDDQ
jgi:hypothetical protein